MDSSSNANGRAPGRPMPSDSASNAPEPVDALDWSPERARSFGEKALDLWTEYLKGLPSFPVSRRLSLNQVREAVTFPVPEEPLTEEALLEHIRKVMFDYSMYPGHPAFFAYISGAGTVPGAIGDFLAAALNQNVGAWRLSPAATEIELNLTRWLARQFGFPDTGGGLFVSGGAVANLVGLKLARDIGGAASDIRTTGLAQKPQMLIYASKQVHGVMYRAVDMLGLGKGAIVTIPTDERDRMRVDLLAPAIEADIARGAHPVAIVGSAGTIETGAIDPLADIAQVAQKYSLWFHVDAAYGGGAILSDELRPLFAGIELADSIAFDPHKWLYTPHSGGCVLVKNLDHLGGSFAVQANYLYQDLERTGRGLDLGFIGPQFSRSFQAFKIWLSLLAHGRKPYSDRITHDARLAEYLGKRVEERPEFELATPVSLSICCFRYVPPGLAAGEAREAYLNLLNDRLLTDIQLDGRVFCSNASREGKFLLRVCIVNFRTEAKQLDLLLDVAAELGGKLDAELRPPALRSA